MWLTEVIAARTKGHAGVQAQATAKGGTGRGAKTSAGYKGQAQAEANVPRPIWGA